MPAKAPRSKAATPAPPAEARVVLLTGPEAGRKHAAAEQMLTERVSDDWKDFDSEIMDGNVATADRILSAVALAPMGSDFRGVLVKDTQQMSPDEQKRLADGLARIPASGFLILHTGTPIVEEGKTKRASVVATELAGAVKKLGRVVDFPLPRTEDVRGWLIAEVKRQGKTIAADALGALAQLPGEDLNRVGNELAKAVAHAGEATQVTLADVEATLSRSPDDVIFKLCDAVGARRAPEALQHVATLFRGGGRPEAIAPRVLVLLARQIRLLAQFKYLSGKGLVSRNTGVLPEEVTRLLPRDGAAATVNNPRTSWMADKYTKQAHNFSGSELVERMERLLAADLALKGIAPGGENPQAVLQRLVVELC